MPAYNAERTLQDLFQALPAGVADEVVLVDDASTDRTAEIAGSLPLILIRHPQNRGYGGNQKTCYDAALAIGADYVVMLHPDGQYDPRLISAALEVLRLGVCDVVLGNRIRTRKEALDGGMPRLKYVSNRALTLLSNVVAGQNLGEWHSGFRAYRREVLERVPYRRNSEGFLFDFQFLMQCVHFGFRLGDLPMPARYFDGMSSIGLRDSSTYALGNLSTLGRWLLHRTGWRSPLFTAREAQGGDPG